MLICEVVGKVWATRKDRTLDGLRFLVVVPVDERLRKNGGPTFVAADAIGADIGERVLVTQGSMARKALGNEHVAADATIVGIVDPDVPMDHQ